MLNYNQLVQAGARITEGLILVFVIFRLLRWYVFYYIARKNGCVSYDFKGKIIRKIYMKPIEWLRQRNHFFCIEQPIVVKDYSEGQSYYVKSKQK